MFIQAISRIFGPAACLLDKASRNCAPGHFTRGEFQAHPLDLPFHEGLGIFAVGPSYRASTRTEKLFVGHHRSFRYEMLPNDPLPNESLSATYHLRCTAQDFAR